MKPRIFIGSSVEGLDLAYAIQENLNYDANLTVWNQGIFKLSSNALDDLIDALGNFDFGIFVFKPDDLTQIRNEKLNTVRDNVIFELGLFIGKLGKERVFFMTPNEADDFHLPTDLHGVISGKYKNGENSNLLSAVAAFCNQIRVKIKDFAYQSLIDLNDESPKAKQIAIHKKDCWEMHLCAELLRTRMVEIIKGEEEVRKGYVFRKTTLYDLKGSIGWFRMAIADFQRLFEIAKELYLKELQKSFGEPGVAGNIFEIKAVADKIASVCKELLAWEVEVQSVITPEHFNQIPELMKGWSGLVINEFIRLPDLLDEGFSEENIAKGSPINIELTFEAPHNVDEICDIMENLTYQADHGLLDI